MNRTPPSTTPAHEATTRAARLLVIFTLALSLAAAAGCAASSASSQSADPAPTATATAATTTAREAPGVAEVPVTESFVEGDALTHEGYTVRKRVKRVRVEYPPGTADESGRTEVSYATLERGGKVLLNFDAGVYRGGMNAASFGLLALLGGDARQLVVSQDAPREGRQWVVSLGPRPRVVFDGPRFGVGREPDEMLVADLDGDGVREIVVLDCGLYGFDGWALAPAATPLLKVVFKYDARAGEYLPANPRFRDYLLRGVEEESRRVAGPEERARHVADVLGVAARYVYAGDERAAWEFYEAAYALPDKARLRRELGAALRARPVYRFIYARRRAGRGN